MSSFRPWKDYSPLTSMNQETYCDTLRKRLFEEQMDQLNAPSKFAEEASQRKIDTLQKRLAECTAGVSNAKAQQQNAPSPLGGLTG